MLDRHGIFIRFLIEAMTRFVGLLHGGSDNLKNLVL